MDVSALVTAIHKTSLILGDQQKRLSRLEQGGVSVPERKPSVTDEDLKLVYNGQKAQENLKESVDEITTRLDYLENEVRALRQAQKGSVAASPPPVESKPASPPAAPTTKSKSTTSARKSTASKKQVDLTKVPEKKEEEEEETEVVGL